MCVLALAWRAHPRWRLIVAANRDELHARLAQALGRWGELAGLLAGQDLQSGGTWLGVSEQGRFAAVTNLRGHGPPDPERASRGALVVELLARGGADRAELADCNPFNLIHVDGANAWYLANRPTEVRRPLAPGTYGLANDPLGESCPRAAALASGLDGWLAGDADDLEPLLDRLGPTAAAQQPSAFIRDPRYGTRCSTMVAVDEQGRGVIGERRYDAEGVLAGCTSLRFAWPNVA